MASRATHTWILLALCACLLGVVVLADFRFLAWSMLYMLGAGEPLGPFVRSDIAAGVIVAVVVAMAAFLAESLKPSGLLRSLAVLPPHMRVRMVIITGFFLSAFVAIHVALVLLVRLVTEDASMSGAEPAATAHLLFGLRYAADDPMLMTIAVMLPVVILGSVVVLLRQIAGTLTPVAKSNREAESVVTRL